MLQRIFNVTAVQRELDHTKRALEATEKELKTITANMVAKEQELVEWQKKCSTSQLELERYRTLEIFPLLIDINFFSFSQCSFIGP